MPGIGLHLHRIEHRGALDFFTFKVKNSSKTQAKLSLYARAHVKSPPNKKQTLIVANARIRTPAVGLPTVIVMTECNEPMLVDSRFCAFAHLRLES